MNENAVINSKYSKILIIGLAMKLIINAINDKMKKISEFNLIIINILFLKGYCP